jgi:hypothetical protein
MKRESQMTAGVLDEKEAQEIFGVERSAAACKVGCGKSTGGASDSR